MAAFAVGDKVRFNEGCGVRKGDEQFTFEVTHVDSQATPFGVFVTYVVARDSRREAVVNGHVRMRAATADEAGR